MYLKFDSFIISPERHHRTSLQNRVDGSVILYSFYRHILQEYPKKPVEWNQGNRCSEESMTNRLLQNRKTWQLKRTIRHS